jgi:ankyrin repeat protein
MSLDTLFSDPQVRALAKAAAAGNISKIDKLVEQGVDVNARGKNGGTPLFWALKHENIKGFSKRLILGADPNVLYNTTGSMIHRAMKVEDDRFIEMGLRHGGDPNQIGGVLENTPVFNIKGQAGKLAILLKYNADINARSQYKVTRSGKPMGETPLISAASHMDFDSVILLLNAGADYSLKDNYGVSFFDQLDIAKKQLIPNSKTAKKLQTVYRWLVQDQQN